VALGLHVAQVPGLVLMPVHATHERQDRHRRSKAQDPSVSYCSFYLRPTSASVCSLAQLNLCLLCVLLQPLSNPAYSCSQFSPCLPFL
jgi:hypothetical protein